MPTVDVVIPCYRYGRFLPACVASVIGQSLPDVRILIIDDASDDDSAVVARTLAAADPRIEVRVHARNHGHIATYNEGIAWAASDGFLILSADDVLAPGALKRAAAVLARHPEVSLTYGACERFPADGHPPPEPDPEAPGTWTVEPGAAFVARACRTASAPVDVPTAVVRTAAQKRVGGYRPDLPHAGDLEMWLRLAADGAVARTDRIQGYWRRHPDSMSEVACHDVLLDYRQRAAAFESFFAGAGGRMEGAEALRRAAFTAIGEQAYWTALARLARGDRAASAELLAMVRRFAPATRFVPPLLRLLRTPTLGAKVRGLVRDTVGRGRDRSSRRAMWPS